MVSFTRSREHIKKSVIKLQKQGCNLFVTGGGDGTLNDIIQYLDEGSILIPLPLGNANDFATRLKIYSWQDTVNIVKNIIYNKINLISIDLGEITYKDKNGNTQVKRFVNNCGIGVTADTVKIVDGQVNKKYLLSGFIALMKRKAFRFTYYSNKDKTNINLNCLGMEFLLTKRVGRHAELAPFKHQNDGTFHFIIFKDAPILRKLKLMSLLQFGKKLVKTDLVEYYHGHTELDTCNSQDMYINKIPYIWGMFHTPLNIHVDGNLLPDFSDTIQKDCKIRILPKFIQTVAPC